ncbi:MAG TPA: biopolymer transporter ExbB, partial [Sphingomonas sp.]|nr:biopolymer transporter ExbB [Sphingomonas sp.]
MTTDPITLGAFLDPAAIGIVAGGTVFATLLRTSLGDVGRGVAALRALARKPFDATPLVDQ